MKSHLVISMSRIKALAMQQHGVEVAAMRMMSQAPDRPSPIGRPFVPATRFFSGTLVARLERSVRVMTVVALLAFLCPKMKYVRFFVRFA